MFRTGGEVFRIKYWSHKIMESQQLRNRVRYSPVYERCIDVKFSFGSPCLEGLSIHGLVTTQYKGNISVDIK
jgi:hypothetical protein